MAVSQRTGRRLPPERTIALIVLPVSPFLSSRKKAVFFSAATCSGAFGGLLAALIQKLNGAGGYEGWRWILILEGILTVVSVRLP